MAPRTSFRSSITMVSADTTMTNTRAIEWTRLTSGNSARFSDEELGLDPMGRTGGLVETSVAGTEPSEIDPVPLPLRLVSSASSSSSELLFERYLLGILVPIRATLGCALASAASICTAANFACIHRT